MTVIALVALGLLIVLGRGIFLLAKPYRKCRWCRKEGFLSLLTLHGRRRCFGCHDTRLERRLGAYHVHKVKLSLIQAWDERGEGK